MDLRGKKYLRKNVCIFSKGMIIVKIIFIQCVVKHLILRRSLKILVFSVTSFSYGEFQARELNTKLIVIIMAGRYVVHFSVGLLLQRDFIIGSFAVS